MNPKLFEDQIDYLYTYMRLSLAAVALLSGFLVYVLKDTIDPLLLMKWSALMVVVIGVRYWTYSYYRRYRNRKSSLFFYRLFFVWTMVTAFLFGGGVVVLFVPDSFPHQVFLSFAFAGISAGASVSLGVRKEMFIAYLSVLMVPLVIAFALSVEEMGGIMATIILVYSLFLVFSSFRLERIIHDGIATKFTNADLLATISSSKAEVEYLNEQLNRKLDRSLDEIEHQKILLFQQSKLVSMGELIGNIAHQWRQPLNALALQIQNLEDAYAFGEVDDAYIAALSKDSMKLINYMSRTIDDFRNFVNPNQKKERFDLNGVINDTVALVESSLRARHIRCSVLNDPAAAKVFAIPGEFKQVLINLLNNSKDAIAERGLGEGEITIALTSDGERAVITVQDNGGGIEESVMKRIFEPYFTTKEEGKGTGIGLYMSYVIIREKMNGTITVSNADSGAVFSITLPIVQG